MKEIKDMTLDEIRAHNDRKLESIKLQLLAMEYQIKAINSDLRELNDNF